MQVTSALHQITGIQMEEREEKSGLFELACLLRHPTRVPCVCFWAVSVVSLKYDRYRRRSSIHVVDLCLLTVSCIHWRRHRLNTPKPNSLQIWHTVSVANNEVQSRCRRCICNVTCTRMWSSPLHPTAPIGWQTSCKGRSSPKASLFCTLRWTHNSGFLVRNFQRKFFWTRAVVLNRWSRKYVTQEKKTEGKHILLFVSRRR